MWLVAELENRIRLEFWDGAPPAMLLALECDGPIEQLENCKHLLNQLLAKPKKDTP